jgi:NADH-quinone oxidoreductase subunit M
MFSSYNFLSIYISYEFSLIPIIYIIVKWGSYPERSLRALILLFYTSFFSLPFMGVLAYFYYYNLSFVVSSLFSLYTISNLLVFITFLTFAVKLPVYGLHF